MMRMLRRVHLEPWQRNLYIVIAAELATIIGLNMANPFLAYYIQNLGVTDLKQVAFWIGLINSGAPIAMAVFSPFWGFLADRYGRKPMLVRAIMGGSIVLIALGLAQNAHQVAAFRIAQGAVTGTVAAATTLVATTVPRERCAFSLGLLQTAVFVGNSVGPAMGGIIGATLGYRVAFLGSGLLLLVTGILVTTQIHERFVPIPVQKKNGNTLVESLQAIASEPTLLAMITMLVLINLSGSVAGPVLPLFVQTLVPNLQQASILIPCNSWYCASSWALPWAASAPPPTPSSPNARPRGDRAASMA